MTKRFRRGASLFLTAVMASTFTAGQALAFADERSGGNAATVSAVTQSSSGRYDSVTATNVTGQINLDSVVLENLSSQVMPNDDYKVENTERTVIVKLEGSPVIDRAGGESVSDYLSTASGARAVRSINNAQNAFLTELKGSGIAYTVVDTYSTVLNAVAIRVNTAYLSAIKKMTGVKAAVVSETYAYPEEISSDSSSGAQSNPSNVYSTGIYDSSKYTAQGIDGRGMTVAVLDTGLDYTHEAFSEAPEELGMDYADVSSKMAASTFNAQLRSALHGNSLTASDVYVSDKVPFAYDYADDDADVYPSYSQHGTHVAGIVAGHAESYDDKDGNKVEEEFFGVAPQAQLVICKVFTDDFDDPDLGGAVTEDIVAALEDCVLLGVDIINMSLGTTSGFSNIYIEGDSEGKLLNETYESIRRAGISLVCAASNDYSSGYGSAFGTNLASNPDSGTVGSPSTYTAAMSVASINGQLSPYMMSADGTPVYYLESSDENSKQYDFAEEMLETATTGVTSKSFKYVIVPGIGQQADYTTKIRNALKNKADGEKVIAVISRGKTTFKEKVEIAASMGADGVIIYNNVAGQVRMSLGELGDARIPAVSIKYEAGRALVSEAGYDSVGEIEINKSYLAGPFMNDYSSWGTTTDLKLKPDITAHGGEITSTVAGGWDEMSGTSMATPNLAGFIALTRGYLQNKFPDLDSVALTARINQIIMSTATTVYDSEHLPYSPRKQGAGLATLDNVFNTNAYLYTKYGVDDYAAEDDRPKLELGEDANKRGVYNLTFYVANFGDSDLTFKTQSLFFTETLSMDGLAVAEQAYMLDDVAAQWTAGGQRVAEGGSITVPANTAEYKIQVTLTLSADEKKYIDTTFINGMFVEGFLKLVSQSGTDEYGVKTQSDLTLPFMGFYGDWDSAPLLDYDCYEIAESQKDSSVLEDEKLQPSVWASQVYATYYNEKYTVPMGSFVYIQDENAQQIYCEEEHSAISNFNYYYGEESTKNYMTSTGLKALYAGLLRNAELVTYTVTNADTGEIMIPDGEVYRVGKARANGGSSVPAQVLLELTPEEMGLKANGRYTIAFHFYFRAEDAKNEEYRNNDNTFSMTFTLDYEAPVLVNQRIRYEDYKENNKIKQRVYLDLDVYDNHYAQSVMLCYTEDEVETENTKIYLATDYVTPVYNAKYNGTTTVSIEITDFYKEYNGRLYVQLDDYALNHNVYRINFTTGNDSVLPSTFSVVGGNAVSLPANTTYDVQLSYSGSANKSNFTWTSSDPTVVMVKDGQLFGVEPGTAYVTVQGGLTSSGNRSYQTIAVTVTESNNKINLSSLSFGLIKNADDNLVKASGAVEVNAGAAFKLTVEAEPWYYPVDTLDFTWVSSNPDVATVDDEGNVQIMERDKSGSVTIQAKTMNGTFVASVYLAVKSSFTVSNFSLLKYNGLGGENGVLRIPDDMNIMYIGEEAFKDNNNVEIIIIPKTVQQINERAFLNCTSLREVYFVDTEKQAVADASAALILKNAFKGCTNLEKIDLSNCKVLTVDTSAFENCTKLTTIVDMKKLGTVNAYAFRNTGLASADISGLHTCGDSAFADCASLASVITGKDTVIGINAFKGCTSLKSVTINCAKVPDGAFSGCSSLTSVKFGESATAGTVFTIGDKAFSDCMSLSCVDFNGFDVSVIGNQAFANAITLSNSESLAESATVKRFTLPSGLQKVGEKAFANTHVTFENGVISGSTLLIAPDTITSAFGISNDVTAIGAYAFSNSAVDAGVTSLTVPASVERIGEGAFMNLKITSVDLISAQITAIPAGAFYGASLTSIVLPAQIKSIGNSAFFGCAALNSVTFNGEALEEVGDYAFYGCTSLVSLDMPDCSVETANGAKAAVNIGNYAFANCTSLERVTLPSVASMGYGNFFNDGALTTLVYGANSEVTGYYNFTRLSLSGIMGTQSALVSVTLGDKATEIDEGAFAYCTALAAIDLKNAATVGANSFNGCSALTTVSGLENVEIIGAQAFKDCVKLTGENRQLDLSSAKEIYYAAFALETAGSGFTSVNMPVAEIIGDYAFYGSGLTGTVNIGAGVVYAGYSAFGGTKITAISVDSGNPTYFDEDGVLYRNVANGDEILGYELIAYPSYKLSSVVSGERTYEIKEGTLTVGEFAFSKIKSGAVARVILPYSVKTIGNGAFYNSGISSYEFHSIQAPTLLTDYLGLDLTESLSGFHAFNYINFEDEFILHVPDFVSATSSALTLFYPSNGSGYDNFVYSSYFAVRDAGYLGELMDDVTRALKEKIEGFCDAQTVSGWMNLEVNAENKAMVNDFSEAVKDAHRTLNGITGAVQLAYLGEENVQRISDLEAALKSVKSRFGIAVKATSLIIAADSAHKTEYKVGDRFSLNGLKLIVVYDDYSQEEADMSQITLLDRFDRELMELDNQVMVEGYGLRAVIGITVTEKGSANPDGGSGGASGCGSETVNPASFIGAALFTVAAIAAIRLLALRRKKD